jgi:hypothetical protein
VALVVGVLLSLFGMCGATRKSVCCTSFFVVVGFLFVLGLWALLAFHVSADVAVSDFCVVSSEYVHDWDQCVSENEQREEEMLPLLDCSSPEQSPQSKSFSRIVKCYGKEDQDMLVSLTWENIATLLYANTNGNFNTSATPSAPTQDSIRGLLDLCSDISFESVGEYRTVFNDSTTLIKGFPGAGESQYIDIVEERDDLENDVKSSSSCSDAKKLLFENLIGSYVGFISVSDDVMKETGCWYVRELVGNVNDAVCGPPQEQLDYLCVALFGIGVLFIFSLVMSVKGMKRYGTLKETGDEELNNQEDRRQKRLGSVGLFA